MSEFIRLQANGEDAFPDASSQNTYRDNGTSVEASLVALEGQITTLGGVAGEAKTLAEQNSVKIATAEQEISDTNSSLVSKIAFPNYNNKIREITSAGETWTATQDCCVVGSVNQNDTGKAASVFVNDNKVCTADVNNNYSIAAAFFFVKKGQVVKTRETYGAYKLSVYALDN